MRTRKNDWIDTKTMIPSFGFQVFHEGQWMSAAENGVPCLYPTEAERNQKQAEFRKMKAPANAIAQGREHSERPSGAEG